ncbi:sulfatase [Flammeovirga kamogawensis]|uniref:Sulfatase n=1 Tax=Flammeovirga kamogawensis TaxID=373891 RepID=A0ABX8H143_9BACT|nr:sulfatase [Flammeovirga kamogawensis]MBB6462293.1 putative sulfatase [Flammeovirga kamogawensis]QWG09317.1 sulfatase [Flammeovirga kamogawensis]TRX64839.1 sulfatase [Flammeovirga kamogawensis]
MKTYYILLLLFSANLISYGQDKPNILFIAYDDLRPLIGAYGEPEPHTPNIDLLANQAVRFNRAYVSYPLCLPSRAAMLTGVRFDNKWAPKGQKITFPKMIAMQKTWPGQLRDNGYWTATRGKLYHGKVPGGDKSSWDIAGKYWTSEYHDGGPEIEKRIVDIGGRQDQIDIYHEKGSGPGSLMYASVDCPDNMLNDGKVAEDVISYIKTKRDKTKPFMIACGFARPHMPWVAPKKYFDMYPEDAGKLAYLPKDAKKDMSNEPFSGRKGSEVWNEGVSDETAQKLIRGYMASTTYADAQMGKVIKALKEEGLYDNTIIVIWGDHGYHLTDHGKWRKNTGYNVALRSPLIIKMPHSKTPKVIENVVQNIDIYPTLMALTESTMAEGTQLHGKSLVPLLKGEKVDWEDLVYTCAQENYGLVTDQYRFTITKDGKYLLYDLKKDPYEWNNLASNKKYKKLINEFEGKLKTVVWNKPGNVL